MNMLKKMIISLLFLIMMGRVAYLNLYLHDHFSHALEDKTIKYVYGSSAPRGRILDTNGVVLVDNIGVKTIYYQKIKGTTLSDEINIAYTLAEVANISINEKSLINFWLIKNNSGEDLITEEEWRRYNERKITSSELKELKKSRVTEDAINSLTELDCKAATIYDLMNKGYSYEPKELLTNLTDDEYSKVIEMNIKGVYGGLKWERIYPEGDSLKDIFGSIGQIPKENLDDYLNEGYEINDVVGLSYLEYQYEDYLKGEKDVYIVNKDNTLSLVKEGSSGCDVYLSIDINMQKELERLIKENILNIKKKKNTDYFEEAYSVVSNPKTGGIMAMAGLKLKDFQNEVFENANINLITKSYTVGSVVKGASMSVGYKYNIIGINTMLTDSCVKLYQVPIKCSYKSLGRLNDITALAKSSNYYQFMIAIGLTNNKYKYNMKLETKKEDFDKYRNMFLEYGLGGLTNIDLPNEKTGIIGNNYSADLLLNLAIGQYDTYTPVELAQYINTIGSTGEKRNISLMQKIVKNDEVILENEYNIVGEVSLDDVYKKRLKEGFKMATTAGTARNYINAKNNPGGKTGTSETFIDTDNDGVMDAKTTSIQFVGFAPFDDPNFSIVVIAPNLYKETNYEYSKVYITRYISQGISNFFFEKE